MNRRHQKRGSTLLSTTMLMAFLSVAGLAYMDSASFSMRTAKKKALDVQMTQLCDAGVQALVRQYWRDFRDTQAFDDMTAAFTGASVSTPKATMTGTLPGVGNYSVGVISFSQPAGDSYSRYVTVRAVGYIDRNGNGVLDANEPAKTVDLKVTFELQRSQVFDYVYFVNNYGWMDGFGPTDLTMNGDLRANGDFSFTNGTPTVNGTVVATHNEKLSSGVAGNITGTPLKWTNSTYETYQTGTSTFAGRMRQAYDSSIHGAKTASQYATWQDIIFESTGSIVNNKLDGSTLSSSNGSNAWQYTSTSTSPTYSLVDSSPSQEVVMPDLSDIATYQASSAAYVDTKQTYGDGTANPNYNQGAWLKVWNSSTNSYQTLTTAGYVNGSAVIVGTSAHPVLIHGPVTISQDAVIKGTVSGQGTIYTGRNVHIIGSIIYNNPPDFRGSNATTIDNTNEKKDLLGLAARASIMMGNPNNYDSYTLSYMTPPWTKSRTDDQGNVIPAFNALATDSTGRKLYQSVISDTQMNSLAEGVNQIDAVMYTNFTGGGDLGTAGGGVTINGSLISRDEAMIVYSLPMMMNYDTRVKERSLTQKPLVDIKLPRSPVLMKSTWQDRGTYYGT